MAEDFTYEPEQGLAKVAQFTPRDSTPVQDPISLRDSTFAKIATKPVSKTAAKILLAPVDPIREVDILPSGECYMSQVFVRRRLNSAFSPMGWALRPLTMETPNTEINQMYQRFALVANGRVVAVAVGSAKYYPKSRDGKRANARMDYADVAESIKSNALTRCCKDLGIGSELWDRRWATEWRNKYAVHVWVAERDRDDRSGTKMISKDYWRRVDSEPFRGEIEPVKDSPNQPAWRAQMEAWLVVMKTETEKTRALKRQIDDAKAEGRKAAAEPATENPTPQAAHVDSKPKGHQVGEQKSTTHAPSAVNVDDRPFLIREVKPVAKGPEKDGKPEWKLYRITMMNGAEWFTFSSRVAKEMQGHFASRQKIEVTSHEIKKSNGKDYNHLVEWRRKP